VVRGPAVMDEAGSPREQSLVVDVVDDEASFLIIDQ
jgi:hypothetical protein